MGLNQFSDLTLEEFLASHTGYKKDDKIIEMAEAKNYSYPAAFDWREKSAVAPIKNQGQCGSCYSFSAVAALESLYFKKNGKILTFSE